jgi:hypothetical protein
LCAGERGGANGLVGLGIFGGGGGLSTWCKRVWGELRGARPGAGIISAAGGRGDSAGVFSARNPEGLDRVEESLEGLGCGARTAGAMYICPVIHMGLGEPMAGFSRVRARELANAYVY